MVEVALTRALPSLIIIVVIGSLHRLDVILMWCAYQVWAGAEVLAEDGSANRGARASTQDRASRIGILGSHLLSWTVPVAALLVYPPEPSSLPWILTGAAAWALGATLRINSIRTLGSSFTAHVRTSSEQALCQTGLYRVMRHPGYVGLFVLNMAPLLALGEPALALVIAPLNACGIGYRVFVEEQELVKRFGEEYLTYSECTPAFGTSLERYFPRRRSLPSGKNGNA